MSGMKRHPFLNVDFQSSVKLKPREEKALHQWLGQLSPVLELLVRKDKLVSASNMKKVRSLKVSLLLCGDTRIRKLNSQYRQKNKVTDVLSFPSYESLRKPLGKEIFITDNELFVGDLVICHPQTIRQARQFNIRYLDEFIHLFLHGFIHLLGYDHERSPEEERLMHKWEGKALESFANRRSQA